MPRKKSKKDETQNDSKIMEEISPENESQTPESETLEQAKDGGNETVSNNSTQPGEESRSFFIDRPFVPEGFHPVETGRYLIPTNEIVRMYNTVKRWLDNRTPGAIVYGRPRIGKTNAITFLISYLKQQLGENLPVFHILCDQHNKPNENTFFENILRDIGHGLQLNGNSSAKRDRLDKFFLLQGEISGQNRIILFVDDAQRLFEIQYGWLMDIYNLLNRHGISLTVILVGQEELIHQKNAFIQSKKAQIIGRFMVHEYKFSGVKNITDIKTCLMGYDTVSEFPQSSGWSFTRYFFPDAFSAGARIESCAEDLFSIYSSLRQEYGIKKPFEIPMEYFTLTINYAMRRYGINGENAGWISREQWLEAVRNSGYIEAEMYQDVI